MRPGWLWKFWSLVMLCGMVVFCVSFAALWAVNGEWVLTAYWGLLAVVFGHGALEERRR